MASQVNDHNNLPPPTTLPNQQPRTAETDILPKSNPSNPLKTDTTPKAQDPLAPILSTIPTTIHPSSDGDYTSPRTTKSRSRSPPPPLLQHRKHTTPPLPQRNQHHHPLRQQQQLNLQTALPPCPTQFQTGKTKQQRPHNIATDTNLEHPQNQNHNQQQSHSQPQVLRASRLPNSPAGRTPHPSPRPRRQSL
jgi:hypothetical protein